jgi:hypothetical protein
LEKLIDNSEMIKKKNLQIFSNGALTTKISIIFSLEKKIGFYTNSPILMLKNYKLLQLQDANSIYRKKYF